MKQVKIKFKRRSANSILNESAGLQSRHAAKKAKLEG